MSDTPSVELLGGTGILFRPDGKDGNTMRAIIVYPGSYQAVDVIGTRRDDKSPFFFTGEIYGFIDKEVLDAEFAELPGLGRMGGESKRRSYVINLAHDDPKYQTLGYDAPLDAEEMKLALSGFPEVTELHPKDLSDNEALAALVQPFTGQVHEGGFQGALKGKPLINNPMLAYLNIWPTPVRPGDEALRQLYERHTITSGAAGRAPA